MTYAAKESNAHSCVVWESIYKSDYEFLFEETVNSSEKLAVEAKCTSGSNEWAILADALSGLDLDKISSDMSIDDCFIDLRESS